MNYLFIVIMLMNELTKILSSQKHRKFINEFKLVNEEYFIKTDKCN
jgi:hypothetical protein